MVALVHIIESDSWDDGDSEVSVPDLKNPMHFTKLEPRVFWGRYSEMPFATQHQSVGSLQRVQSQIV